MTQNFKGFGLVKSCNYRSNSKWVITKEGATIGNAPTLQEAKEKISRWVSRGFLYFVVYMTYGGCETKMAKLLEEEEAKKYVKELQWARKSAKIRIEKKEI